MGDLLIISLYLDPFLMLLVLRGRCWGSRASPALPGTFADFRVLGSLDAPNQDNSTFLESFTRENVLYLLYFSLSRPVLSIYLLITLFFMARGFGVVGVVGVIGVSIVSSMGPSSHAVSSGPMVSVVPPPIRPLWAI